MNLSRLNQLNAKYKNVVTVILFIVVFKVVSTLFYGCYFYFFNSLSPRWNVALINKFNVHLYFLQLKPYLDVSFFISSFKSPTNILGVLIFLYLLKNRRKISWDELGVNRLLKFFFIVPGLILCWELLAYDYNFYLDHYFFLERFLMLGFLLLVWFHPMYSVWFLMLALMFRAQFDFPIGGFPLFDKKVLFDLYVLIIAYLVMKTRMKLPVHWLLFFSVALVASSYFATGLGKIRLTPHGYEWITQNPLDYLIMNANERGWPYSSGSIAFIEKYKLIIQFLTIALELSVLFIFYKRKLAIALISCCILFHLSIFCLSGILFWKWIVVDLMVVVVLLSRKDLKAVFNPTFFKLSFILIPTSIFWLSAFAIGWLDTKFNQTFEYTVVLENGEEYNASKSIFNPYHQLFYHDKFLYTTNEKRIKITGFGYTFAHPVADAINRSTLNELADVETQFGQNYYSKEKDNAHTEFIKTFFTNYNRHLETTYYRNWINAPEHIYNFPPEPVYHKQGKIKTVNVYLKKTYIENHKLVVLDRKLIKSVSI